MWARETLWSGTFSALTQMWSGCNLSTKACSMGLKPEQGSTLWKFSALLLPSWVCEQQPLDFHFVLGSTNYVASLRCIYKLLGPESSNLWSVFSLALKICVVPQHLPMARYTRLQDIFKGVKVEGHVGDNEGSTQRSFLFFFCMSIKSYLHCNREESSPSYVYMGLYIYM